MSLNTCQDDLDALSDLFVAQDARPRHLVDAPSDALGAFARVLLVTDGTVTHMLRAWFREPVEVVVEAQDLKVLDKDDPWLEIQGGCEILVRDVALRGQTSGRVFANARSLIALDRLSEQMRDDIITMRRSIGNVLLANFSENRRELLWHGLVKEDLIEKDLASLERTYRVITKATPLMTITETFTPLILTDPPT